MHPRGRRSRAGDGQSVRRRPDGDAGASSRPWRARRSASATTASSSRRTPPSIPAIPAARSSTRRARLVVNQFGDLLRAAVRSASASPFRQHGEGGDRGRQERRQTGAPPSARPRCRPCRRRSRIDRPRPAGRRSSPIRSPAAHATDASEARRHVIVSVDNQPIDDPEALATARRNARGQTTIGAARRQEDNPDDGSAAGPRRPRAIS